MNFGLSIAEIAPRYYARGAPSAEDAGFETLYVSEHLVFPATVRSTYPYRDDGVLRVGKPMHVGCPPHPAQRRAGLLGDGWIEHGATDINDALAQLALIEAVRARVGRQDRPFELSISCSAGPSIDEVHRAAEAGVHRVNVVIDVGERITPRCSQPGSTGTRPTSWPRCETQMTADTRARGSPRRDRDPWPRRGTLPQGGRR